MVREGGGLHNTMAWGCKHERCERFVCVYVVFFAQRSQIRKTRGAPGGFRAPLESVVRARVYACARARHARMCVRATLHSDSRNPVLEGNRVLLLVYSRTCRQSKLKNKKKT